MIEAIKYARINQLPFLGICFGMQLAVVEFARHVLGLKEATSSEFVSNAKEPVIIPMEELDKEYMGTYRATSIDRVGELRVVQVDQCGSALRRRCWRQTLNGARFEPFMQGPGCSWTKTVARSSLHKHRKQAIPALSWSAIGMSSILRRLST
jgi:Glutamine amidotransferase class-I